MNRKIKRLVCEFFREEDGIGVVEIILILVILIGLVVIFKSQIESIVKSAFQKVTGDSGTILD